MLGYLFSGVKALVCSWLLLLLLSTKSGKPDFKMSDLTLQVSIPFWIGFILLDNRKPLEIEGKSKK